MPPNSIFYSKCSKILLSKRPCCLLIRLQNEYFNSALDIETVFSLHMNLLRRVYLCSTVSLLKKKKQREIFLSSLQYLLVFQAVVKNCNIYVRERKNI